MSNQTHLLKQYQSQLSQLEGDILAVRSEIGAKGKVLTAKQKSAVELRDKIKALTVEGDTITVSEHALLRYCERVLNIDLEEAKQAILSDSVVDLMAKLGNNNGEYPVKEGGFKIVVKNKTVVTIK